MKPAFEVFQDATASQSGTFPGVPRLLEDIRLPQLDVVRDPLKLKIALQRALFQSDNRHRITDCAITYILYSPGESCLIACRICVSDLATGQNSVQRVCVIVVPDGLSKDLFARLRNKNLSAIPLSNPTLHLPDLCMGIWLFPNDPQLEGLPALIDEGLLANSVLPHLAVNDCGPAWTVSNWHTEIVSYVPGYRSTLRAVVQLRQKVTGETRVRTYYGKVYPNHIGQITQRNMNNLWNICCGPLAPFRVARALYYLEQSKILWQSGITGMPLTALGAGSPELLALLKQAARAIGALHSSNLECPGWIPRPSPLELLAQAREILCRADHCPTRLVEQLIASAPDPEAFPRATVHRDFHLDNIISTNDGIALIDLDDLANGDPVEDLTRFLAHLCSWSMRRGLDGQQIEPMVSTVVQSYVSAVPWCIEESVFRWHLAAALIYQQACRCITRPHQWRLATLNNVIRLAERVSSGVLR